MLNLIAAAAAVAAAAALEAGGDADVDDSVT